MFNDFDDELEVTWDCQSPINHLKKRNLRSHADSSPVVEFQVNDRTQMSRKRPEELQQLRRQLIALTAQITESTSNNNNNNEKSIGKEIKKSDIDEIFGEDVALEEHLSQIEDIFIPVQNVKTKPVFEQQTSQRQLMTKIVSQPKNVSQTSKCSPEEIERKRLEAKAKMMAKQWERKKQDALIRLKRFRESGHIMPKITERPTTTVTTVGSKSSSTIIRP